MEPVDPNEAPDYYKVIKEPMGKDFFIHSIFFFLILLNIIWSVLFAFFRSPNNRIEDKR